MTLLVAAFVAGFFSCIVLVFAVILWAFSDRRVSEMAIHNPISGTAEYLGDFVKRG